METVEDVVRELEQQEINAQKARRIASLRIWFAVGAAGLISVFLLVFIFIGPFYDWLEKDAKGPITYGFGTKALTMQIIQLVMIVMSLGTAGIMYWWYKAYKKDIEKT
jgi:uncharacterized Tic20 family protein